MFVPRLSLRCDVSNGFVMRDDGTVEIESPILKYKITQIMNLDVQSIFYSYRDRPDNGMLSVSYVSDHVFQFAEDNVFLLEAELNPEELNCFLSDN